MQLETTGDIDIDKWQYYKYSGVLLIMNKGGKHQLSEVIPFRITKN